MTVKEELKAAGRYDQVMNILKSTIMSTQGNYPVDCYPDENGKASFDVDAMKVRVEASRLMIAIDDNTIKNMTFENFRNLWQYVHSNCDMLLHNYAVSVCHRTEPPKIDIDKARVWCILDNLIICLNPVEFDDEDETDWTIPNGWKDIKYVEQKEGD